MTTGIIIAVVLGIAAGAGLAFLNRWGAEFMGPEDSAGLGMVVALGTLTFGLLVAMILLFAAWYVAKPYFAWFGIPLALSFLVSTIVALLPQLRSLRTDVKGR